MNTRHAQPRANRSPSSRAGGERGTGFGFTKKQAHSPANSPAEQDRRQAGSDTPARRFRGILAAAAAIAAVAGLSSRALADSFFAAQVIGSPVVGSPSQAAFRDPAEALGPPTGRGNASTGSEGSLDVYNLGGGGSMVLGFDDGPSPRAIVDGPGFDFIVFENAFYAGGQSTLAFAELVFVEVSSDGVNFARFPNLSTTPPPPAGQQYNTIDAANVSGFAGVHPVFANANDPASPSPFDAANAGGDAFDLAQLAADPLVLGGSLDLSNVRFVRLIDVVGDGSVNDTSGNPIYDPSGPIVGGADIDSVAVIHGVPEPGAAVFIAFATIALRRRR